MVDRDSTILMVCTRDGLGGSAIVAARLSAGLIEEYKWNVLSVCNDEGPVYEYYRRLGLPTIPIFETVGMDYTPDPRDGNLIRRMAKRLKIYLGARRYLKKHRPLIIHTHDESGALGWGMAARSYGVPVIWHVHQQLPQRWTDKVLRRLSTHIILVARSNRKRFATKSIPEISTIYNGTDLSVYHPPQEPRRNHRPIIGFLSNLEDRKRPEWAVRAMVELNKEGIDCELLMAGRDLSNGKKPEAFQRMAKAGGVEDRFSYIGFSDDIPALLRTIDIFVLPSERDKEALPLSIVEAMASGATVVASDTASIPEVVTAGVSGELFDPDDFSAFLNAVRRLIIDPDLRHAYAKAALAQVQSGFSLNSSIRDCDHLYHDILQRHDTNSHSPRQKTRIKSVLGIAAFIFAGDG